MSAGQKITLQELKTIMDRLIQNISDVQVNKIRFPHREYNLLIHNMYSTKKTLENLMTSLESSQAQPFRSHATKDTLIYDKYGNVKHVNEKDLNEHKEEWEYMFDDNLLNPPSYLYPPTNVYDTDKVKNARIPQPNQSMLQ